MFAKQLLAVNAVLSTALLVSAVDLQTASQSGSGDKLVQIEAGLDRETYDFSTPDSTSDSTSDSGARELYENQPTVAPTKLSAKSDSGAFNGVAVSIVSVISLVSMTALI